MRPKRIALIGDFNPTVLAHQAIPRSLALANRVAGGELAPVWLATDKLTPRDPGPLTGFAGMWCVPASPYASMAGALWAIQFARENQIPFLGTCGGFQHALIEYARNVCGLRDADHAETNPAGGNLVITPLACALVEQTGTVRLKEGSLLRRVMGAERIVEGYHCRFGLNPAFRSRLENGDLEFTGWDEESEIRALELRRHPFFVATLFQPERAALRGEHHPLISAFVAATRHL